MGRIGFDGETLRLVGDYLGARHRRERATPEMLAAWDRFHQACDGVVRRSLRVRGLSPSEQDDCAQEVWIDLIEKGDCTAQSDHIIPRVAAIARNKAIDRVRQRLRLPTIRLDRDYAATAAADNPDPAGLARALVWPAMDELERRIPAPTFLAFSLRWLEGWTNAEIADLLGLTPPQVRLRLHRASRSSRD